MKDELTSKPLSKPLSEIAQDAVETLRKPPSEVHIDVKLYGNDARRYAFAKQIIKSAFDLKDEEIDTFLVRSGAERQLEKMSQVWKDLSEN